MGPSLRREREKQMLREQILQTARQLFAERGYEQVTIRTIADSIEYSPRTIYLYFKDKEDLIRQLVRADFLTFGLGLGQLVEIEEPLARLRAIGQAYAQFARQYPHHYKLMFMTPPTVETCPQDDDPEMEFKDDPEVDAYALLRNCLVEAIARGCLRAELTDPDHVSQVVWSGLHGVMALYITQECDPWIPWVPVQQRVDLMLDLLIRGLQA